MSERVRVVVELDSAETKALLGDGDEAEEMRRSVADAVMVALGEAVERAKAKGERDEAQG